ncbi:hypothetical protein [Motilimonas sp. KMU-193]|uniref:hypothetical protein n=1 Tax=Motilimonas sp. KMU-193 TaxID=3388668 RepID=UPI00396B1F7D
MFTRPREKIIADALSEINTNYWDRAFKVGLELVPFGIREAELMISDSELFAEKELVQDVSVSNLPFSTTRGLLRAEEWQHRAGKRRTQGQYL